MTRDNEFSALQLNNVYGTRVAVDNIIVNGTYAWPATESNNLIDVDPMFNSAPETVNGPLTIEGTDFSLMEGSPAINAGNPSYSPSMILTAIQDRFQQALLHQQVLKMQLEVGQHLVQQLKQHLNNHYRVKEAYSQQTGQQIGIAQESFK